MRKVISFLLSFAILTGTMTGINSSNYTLKDEDISMSVIENEIQERYDEVLSNFAEQLSKQGALDKLEVMGDAVYLQICKEVYSEYGLSYLNNVEVMGSDDEVYSPPTYTMPYGGIVKYTKAGNRITVTCLDRQQSFSYLLGLRKGDILEKWTMIELLNWILEKCDKAVSANKAKVLGTFTNLVASSLIISEYESIEEAQEVSPNCLLLVSCEDLSTGEVGNTVESWHHFDDYTVPSGTSLWTGTIFES